MSIILYMAISRDGFIAGPNEETPWSNEEWVAFQEFVKSCDIILLGKRTFQIMQKQNEFILGPRYIVVTTDNNLNTGVFEKLAIHSPTDIPTANKIGVIGGGDLNGRLAKLGIIDELILDRENIKLHSGIKLFGNHDVSLDLKLIESRVLGNDTTQHRYKTTRH